MSTPYERKKNPSLTQKVNVSKFFPQFISNDRLRRGGFCVPPCIGLLHVATAAE